MSEFWPPWPQWLKTTFVVIVVLLALALLSLFIYHLSYRTSCVPKDQFDTCKAALNATELSLEKSETRNNQLESEKANLLNIFSKCEADLAGCKSKLSSLNESYNSLFDKYSKLNASYNALFSEYQKCKGDLESKGNASTECKENTNQDIKALYLSFRRSYVTISLFSIVLFLSLSPKIEFEFTSKNKKVKWMIIVFVVAFYIIMYLLNYVDLKFWIKTVISFLLAFLLGLIAFLSVKE